MFIYTFDLTALIASIIGIFGVIIGVIFERKNAERIHSKQIAHYRMEKEREAFARCRPLYRICYEEVLKLDSEFKSQSNSDDSYLTSFTQQFPVIVQNVIKRIDEFESQLSAEWDYLSFQRRQRLGILDILNLQLRETQNLLANHHSLLNKSKLILADILIILEEIEAHETLLVTRLTFTRKRN